MSELKREPAWLLAKLDQRVAFMEHKMREQGVTIEMLEAQPTVVMTFLTEPEQDNAFALARWEHTCDNCGQFAPHQLHTGVSTRKLFGKQRVLIQYGVCTTCKDAD